MIDIRKQGGEEQHQGPEPESKKSPFAKREEAVLAFWREQEIFEQTLRKPAPKGEYIFYDGPPFANGLPHYGHILASAIKDAIPRYRTMRGYHVARRWGWDCHGLPVENLVEKELGFKNKRDIEQYGIAKFNAAARKSIMQDVSDWKRIIPRMGRWVDMERDYKTMDPTYTESVWWAFKNLHGRGLLYEGFKAMHLCPRCGTTLSNFEVALGYKDIEDFAVTVKLPLLDEPGTSLLIWTTTPWTLPGNAAAAVNAEATYVKARVDGGFVVVAKERASAVLGPDAALYGEISGKDLVGKRYVPPFPYFTDLVHKHKTHAWRVYAAPYVTLEDGTGIVHLAPAYGADDLALAQKEKIPLIHHVTDEGVFTATVADFAHLPVKPKGHHMDTDAKIVDNLRQRGLLFKEEKITHSYPHCWRCDTPLLNWAANSWFVKVSAIKNKLLKQNSRVQWVPERVGTGRFHKGIESAPDWAISRSRFWGAPIPVWRHSKTKEVKVVGSVDELLSLAHRSGNRYFLMRHGQAQHNIAGVADSGVRGESHLTEEGKQTVRQSGKRLAGARIDLIITSPVLRARQTAALMQKEFNLPDSAVMVDERLREVGFGAFDGKPLSEWEGFFRSFAERFEKAPEGGEPYTHIRRRVGEFLFEIERRYAKKNILIVTHRGPAGLLCGVAAHAALAEAEEHGDAHSFTPGEVREIPFIPFPHNDDFELDLHRPYIDDVPLGDSLSGEWKRVPDVFDCWFESGSMPYASRHYPLVTSDFNPKRAFGFFSKGYPADFIAEGLDQTRGWFYSLIVLGTALFGKAPYKNVIVNGLVLAADGQKMSKRLKNYPDPMDVVDSYGADSLRYYLLSSPVIRGEDLRFSARGVEEVAKKLLMRLDNVRSFYDLYAPAEVPADTVLSLAHPLDAWILSRLGELVRDTTAGFEAYELDAATRPLAAFIDDLSTWYLRRSRERFKTAGADKDQALATLRATLAATAAVMAPVMPFFADDLYRRIKREGDAQSVHLMAWPEPGVIDSQLLADMARVRQVASRALELRERAGIKIRQPLGALTAKQLPRGEALRALIAEEVNVKTVAEDATLTEDVVLDTALTPELKEEGLLRDLVRLVQDFRKEEKLTIADRPKLTIATDTHGKAFLEKHLHTLVEETNLAGLEIAEGGENSPLPFPLTLTLGR